MPTNFAPDFWKSIQKTIVIQRETTPIKSISQNKNLLVPLSYNQEQIWQLETLNNDSVYNITNVLRFSLKFNFSALEKSLREIVRRHKILRTTFPLVDGRPIQNITSLSTFSLPLLDLKELSTTEKETRAKNITIAERQKTFNLTEESGFRVKLLHLAETDFIVILTMHHIIFDGASFRVLFQELKLLYDAFINNKPNPLPELEIQYIDFVYWQRKLLEDSTKNYLFNYWQKKLQGKIEPLQLPQDNLRSAAFNYQGDFQTFQLPTTLTTKIQTFRTERGVTLFSILLTAFKVLLYCYSKQEDIILVSPIEGRNQSETKNLIGYFNNLLVLRDSLENNPTFLELLNRVNNTFLQAKEHQDFPFAKIAEFPNLARVPLSRCMFAFSNYKIQQPQLLGKASTSINTKNISQEKSNFDLSLSMKNIGNKLSGIIKYKTSLFTNNTIGKIIKNFEKLLYKVITNPKLNLKSLASLNYKIIDKDERQVKIHGLEIKLSEIETVLAQHPKIKKSVVLVKEDNSENKTLIAYIIPNELVVPSLEELRLFLIQKLPQYLIPSVLVPVEAIPLTSKGKVDKKALAKLNIRRQISKQNYVPPRNGTEKKLAQIWAKVLWLEKEIGIYDNFFDLGGHSLLLIRLIAEIEKTFNKKVPLTKLSQLETIAELGEIIAPSSRYLQDLESDNKLTPTTFKHPELSQELYDKFLVYTAGWKGKRIRSHSLIVGLNTNGNKQPIFCCLHTYQSISNLSKYFGEDRPVYGMRADYPIMKGTPGNIKALASQYVSEILPLQSDGSFILLGYCSATPIVSEIARQLIDKGHTINLLILIERFVTQIHPSRVALLFARDSYSNPYKQFYNPELGYRKFCPGGYSVNLISGKHSEVFDEPNIQRVTKLIEEEIEKAQLESVKYQQNKKQYQLLPSQAYKAKISSEKTRQAIAGQSLIIAVRVQNISSCTWQPTINSGIRLGNHWLDEKGKIVSWSDGVTNLDRRVLPGEFINLDLLVNIPIKPGNYQLEIDLFEEGVTWFKYRGSQPNLIVVKVLPSENKASMEIGKHGFPLIKSDLQRLKFPYPQLEKFAPNFIGGFVGSETSIISRIVRQGNLFIGNNPNCSIDLLPYLSFRKIAAYWQKPMPVISYKQIVTKLETGLKEYLADLDSDSIFQSWGWNIPQSIFLLPFLHQQFPNIKCLHLVRDGRDLAFSGDRDRLKSLAPILLNSEQLLWSQPLQSIALWNNLNLLTAEYGEKYMSSQYLRIRFEDLCSQPFSTIESIFEFLGLSGNIQRIAKEEISSPISLGCWQKRDSNIIVKLNNIGGVALQKFGYLESDRVKYYSFKGIKLQQKNALFYCQEGNTYFDKGDMELAITNYQKAIALNPNLTAELYQKLGNAYSQKENFTEAIFAYKQALKLKSNKAQIYFMLANALVELDNLAEAIPNYQKAIKLEPNNSEYYQNLGQVFHDLGQFKAAIEMYNTAIKFNSKNFQTYCKLGRAQIKNKQFKKAIDNYNIALELYPENSYIYAQLGNVYCRRKNYSKAISYYKKAVKFKPHKSKFYIPLGNAQLKSGKIKSAISSYQKAIELDPQQPFDVYENLGDALRRKGKTKEAVAAYVKALEIKGETIDLLQKS